MDEELKINLAAGAEEIGLAVMLQDLMTQNIEQHPRKLPDFKKLNIPIGLIVSDLEIELTLEFAGGTLTIHPGVKNQPGLRITADSATVMNLSNQRIKWGLPYYFDETGKEIMAAMKNGRLKVNGMIKHFASLIRFARVMSVHG
ncbi:MAG: SCP2 sterol-binding domain-containing protein [Planctomycetales bacterium]|nr:SCP2 sterol-binding domain-containing protein [Planctomycetales bacterium]